ncbi:MAG: metallophosphoesterase [Clostridia bacterium]|nr:metallophosphoesterase [Clostridia bacterium]
MKLSRKRKLITLILSLLMILPLIPVSAAEDIPTFFEGETVYSPNLKGSGNGVPDGWLAVPETQVPWLNGGDGGAWVNFDPNNTHNKEINTERFTYTATGLKVNIGNCDFSVVFPALVDGDGTPVTDYVYSITISGFGGSSAKGSLGPITDAQGGVDYKGGTYLMMYAAGSGSYRHYTFTERSRRNDYTVEGSDEKAIQYETGKVTLKVYHCEGTNYYFANDKFLYSKTGLDAYNGAALNGIGMNFCGTQELIIESITVKKAVAKGLSDAIKPLGASIRYCDVDGSTVSEGSDGLRFSASVDKTSDLYKALVPEGTYDPSNEKIKFGMLIIPTDLIDEGEALKHDTPNVSDTVITKLYSQDKNTLTFNVSLLGIPQKHQARSFTARVYIKELTERGWEYTYSNETITRSYVGVANLFYEDAENDKVRERLDYLFRKCDAYEGKNAERLKFCLFSDFHYKQGMYMTSIADMQTILDRAHAADVDFIIHGGDFCNDYNGSPELMNAYLRNAYGLSALGVIGNHEMETKGNSMPVVTALLNNREVVWGTADGKIGDGSIGYYYYETNGFRIVCPDTNYSYDTTNQIWEHNLPATSGPPSENTKGNSLGPVQLQWLEDTLLDAASKDIPCIVVSHASFSGVWSSSPDAAAVRAIFKKANNARTGTVLMAINGHLHTNRAQIVDSILYMDMNATRNVVWRSDKVEHYTDPSHTFEYITYDNNGAPLYTQEKSLNTLSMGKNTWFSADPLSAIVTVSTSGRITIDGCESEWIYGVVPPNTASVQGPVVLTETFDLPLY